jgi:succinate dehydrogenase/fumarate reductase cytochrome b subunit
MMYTAVLHQILGQVLFSLFPTYLLPRSMLSLAQLSKLLSLMRFSTIYTTKGGPSAMMYTAVLHQILGQVLFSLFPTYLLPRSVLSVRRCLGLF